LTIQNAQKAKLALAAAVATLVKEYEAKTDTSVTKIGVNRTFNYNALPGKAITRPSTFQGVEVTVEI